MPTDFSKTAAAEAEKLLRSLGSLDVEQQALIRLTLDRAVSLAVDAVGATPEHLSVINVEGKALLATLATLGEEKAATVQAALEGFLTRLMDLAISAALGSLATLGA